MRNQLHCFLERPCNAESIIHEDWLPQRPAGGHCLSSSVLYNENITNHDTPYSMPDVASSPVPASPYIYPLFYVLTTCNSLPYPLLDLSEDDFRMDT
jgi:hypothetical protein